MNDFILPLDKFEFHLVHHNWVVCSMILGLALVVAIYSNHHNHDFHSIEADTTSKKKNKKTIYINGTFGLWQVNRI